ncbi:MAG: NAD(P)H-dependent oxidoreductase subunit E [Fidelibacterota bacterium]|nr:MAG: NAD(P)H-dependent oxidoreductase subunit E [Candidatus Neomarinimicrobiota bacterium]
MDTVEDKQMNPVELVVPDEVQRIIEKHQGKRGDLIAILEDIQARYRYLPEEALKIIAKNTEHSIVDMYAVATFFERFSLKPQGRHIVSVCLGTACHVRGGPDIASRFERKLEISPGETTPDLQYTLKAVNCLGACAMGPIVVADGHYFSSVRMDAVDEIVAQTRDGLDQVHVGTDQRIFPLEVRCLHCNHSLMDSGFPIDGYPSIKLTTSFKNKHGWVRLSSLYGSYSIVSEYEIPPDTVRNFFCPHCHAEIIGAGSCAECGAPMVPMNVRGGGIVQVCSRRACKGHLLDLASNPVD